MTVFTLIRALVADLRAHDLAKAALDFALLMQVLLGFTPTPPAPSPTPPITPGGFAASDAAEINDLANKLEAFVNENDPGPGFAKIGDGVLLGKLIELLKLVLPLIVKL